MTKKDAVNIIRTEQLENYNLCEQRSHYENEMGIQNLGEHWAVYSTNERAGVVSGSEVYFQFEGDAWDNFIDRLRALNRLRILTGGLYY